MSDTNSESCPSKSTKAKKEVKKGSKTLRETVRENSETLKQLKDLPSQIATIIKTISTSNEPDEPAVIDPIDNLLDKTSQDEQIAPENASLIEDLRFLQPEPEFGEELNADVADSINSLFSGCNAKTCAEKTKLKPKLPANCVNMSTPRVNPEIWSILPHAVKQKDFILQQQQQLVTTSAIQTSMIVNKLFTRKEQMDQSFRKELIRDLMEVLSTDAAFLEEMSKKRRMEIKPSLNREYSGICSTATTAKGFLFGENVLDQLKATKSTAQMARSAIRGFDKGSYRFTPFKRPNLNYQGPPNRMRGAYRGSHSQQNNRGRQHSSRARQNYSHHQNP